MSREIQEVSHARLEPAVSGCPGLFTARSQNGRAVHITQQVGDNIALMWSAADQLTPADLMTLAALVALAGPGGRVPGEHDHALVVELHMRANGELAQLEGPLVIETTAARVLRECGLSDGGSVRVALRASLRRLASLLAIARRRKREVSMHLLSYAVDEDSGELRVALSPRVTAAILGGRYTRIELAELRALGEHARLLYVRICAWVDPGRTRSVRLRVLMEYLWPDPPTREWEKRNRRRRVRRAMHQLGALPGWRVEARGVQYTISRPPVISATPPVISATPPVISATPPVISATPEVVIPP